MAKARNPITFGKQFGIADSRLAKLGVLNPTIAIDTPLFIDPMLLEKSAHDEIHVSAAAQYKRFFEKVIALLAASAREGDAAWKAAGRMLAFPEIQGNCLGYGAGSIRGSGFGKELSNRILRVAVDIVKIGVKDPDLFTAMALFESDIGPDRLSDMTTNIIVPALSQFNTRILKALSLKGHEFVVGPSRGTFLVNPLEAKRTPIILLPSDILRDLPIAHDWDGVAASAAENEALRTRVNEHISEIWELKSKRDKAKLKEQALANRESFEALLEAIRAVPASSYNSDNDSKGLLRWASKGAEYAQANPINIPASMLVRDGGAQQIVKLIVDAFVHLVEHQGLNKELYQSGGKPRHESTAQRLFFAVAYAYCKANDLDVSPEVDTGTGKIDFKFSAGFKSRVLVEVKLSTNKKIISGYTTQLEVYKESQEALIGYYLVIDVGYMASKDMELIAIKNNAAKKGVKLSELVFVDGKIKPSASKLVGWVSVA